MKVKTQVRAGALATGAIKIGPVIGGGCRGGIPTPLPVVLAL